MRVATIATLVHIILFREAIVISRYRLVVRVTGGDIDHASVRHRHRLEESQRTAVSRWNELHGDLVALVKSIRAARTDSALRQRRGRAQRKYPVGRRSVLIPDGNRERSMRIHKLDALDRARDFSVLAWPSCRTRPRGSDEPITCCSQEVETAPQSSTESAWAQLFAEFKFAKPGRERGRCTTNKRRIKPASFESLPRVPRSPDVSLGDDVSTPNQDRRTSVTPSTRDGFQARLNVVCEGGSPPDTFSG